MIRWAGTTYSVHPLFVLLLALSAITGHILELITLFSIVLIHEMGHVVTAKCLGWTIDDVKLLPFGGVAETKDGAIAPAWQECLVAIAGPLQNGFMIAIAYGCYTVGWWDETWTSYFIQANTLIGLFNLLPILPLDGGRIVQAACGRWISYYRSLVVGAWTSIVSSVLLGIYALVPLATGKALNLNVLVLALFLLWTNWVDRRHIHYRFIRFLMNRPFRLREWERRICMAQPIIADGKRPLSRVLKLLRRDMYHLVYVMGNNGVIQRVIPEQQVIDSYFDQHKKDAG
ncbi:M50 family metallopeptidase [Paenibacillus taiwanensis]|uniref:M50 family metallopeptidase n=1 Tax=Paenibacillus taiwanensis TaxID=401638 RepID=UPI00041A1310|nr:M50 family metallopeptidase [Paenibacillus taiwanensis]